MSSRTISYLDPTREVLEAVRNKIPSIAFNNQINLLQSLISHGKVFSAKMLFLDKISYVTDLLHLSNLLQNPVL